MGDSRLSGGVGPGRPLRRLLPASRRFFNT